MIEKKLIFIDEVPDNLLSNLENRDVVLWVHSLPNDLPSQDALVAFLGLPWRLVFSEIYDPGLIKALEGAGIGIFLSFFTKTAFPIGILFGAAIIAIISTLLYSTFGGFKRDIYTDIAQMIFITIGVSILFLWKEVSYAQSSWNFLTKCFRSPQATSYSLSVPCCLSHPHF